MKIGPWVARKRKAFGEARFAVTVANCNASMMSCSQHDQLCHDTSDSKSVPIEERAGATSGACACSAASASWKLA